jgi:hypothetical protein
MIFNYFLIKLGNTFRKEKEILSERKYFQGANGSGEPVALPAGQAAGHDQGLTYGL